MTNSSHKQPIDRSKINTIISNIQSNVDALHAALDGFAERRAAKLYGSHVRDAIGAALGELDRQLKKLHQIRQANEKRTQGYITADIRDLIVSAIHHVTRLDHELIPILWDSRQHRISASTRDELNSSLYYLRLGIGSLEHATNPDEQDLLLSRRPTSKANRTPQRNSKARLHQQAI
jgi:hypothetical protein